jgi:hypothetical protein
MTLVYIGIFALLVVLGLFWKASSGKHVTTAGPNSSLHVGSGQSLGAGGGTGNGPSIPVDSEFAKKACTQNAPTQGGTFTLVGAFEVQAGAVSTWVQGLSGGKADPPLPNVDTATKVAVCYFDGPWNPPDAVKQFYASKGLVPDRGIIFVTDQNQVFDGPQAPKQSLPVQRPSS